MGERVRYIAESAVPASPITEAQRAFFRYQITLGSLNYAQQHGPRSEANALARQVFERYEEYTALRDGRLVSYDIVAGGSPDQDEPHSPHERPPLRPNELSPELAAFLRDQDYACVTQATDRGTVLVLKAPRREIDSARGSVPIQFRHELYEHPAAPVIRMVARIYDQPERPLAFETFINVEDPQKRADYASLATQEHLYLLFYDESLEHRLTKAVGAIDRATVTRVLGEADRRFAAIPRARFDFDRAKADVMARTTL